MKAPTETQRRLREALRQYARNFRWGTCGACPRSSDGEAFPEFCEYTDRYDHHINGASLSEVIAREVKERTS